MARPLAALSRVRTWDRALGQLVMPSESGQFSKKTNPGPRHGPGFVQSGSTPPRPPAARAEVPWELAFPAVCSACAEAVVSSRLGQWPLLLGPDVASKESGDEGTPRNSRRFAGTWSGDAVTGRHGGTGGLCAGVVPLAGPPRRATSGHSPGACRGQEAAVCPSIQVCSVNPGPPVRTGLVGRGPSPGRGEPGEEQCRYRARLCRDTCSRGL